MATSKPKTQVKLKLEKIPPIRLSVSESAKLLGVHTHTIRQAIKAQELAYIVVRGRYKLSLPSLIAWSQKNTWRKNKLEKYGIGQYVEKWKIRNTLYSPNPNIAETSQTDSSI
ncbi:MAG: hypothetical protein UW24_C0014G0015 [Parcubacteria group bacterium GW2011_GWA2_44_12]|nr:MAG: hypothetical protein UW24_C0014G0015 [Parcubacteria group bacterium GW2011_GWA2_44_12]